MPKPTTEATAPARTDARAMTMVKIIGAGSAASERSLAGAPAHDRPDLRERLVGIVQGQRRPSHTTLRLCRLTHCFRVASVRADGSAQVDAMQAQAIQLPSVSVSTQ
jgi:hypothetical protein